MSSSQCILIMAGGTGGHVVPALDVAKAFIDKGYQVHWLGTKKGIESRLVPAAGVPIHYLSVSGVRGSGILRKLLMPFVLLRSVLQSIRRIQKLKPVLVMGFGGYASGPGGLAAWILRKPLVIHEQNAIAGKTNYYLSFLAKKTLAAFPSTKGLPKAIIVGNPVRAEIGHASKEEDAYPLEASFKAIHGRRAAINILVIGGSGGAKQLNETVPQALSYLNGYCFKVWHQSGKNSYNVARDHYEDSDMTVHITPYIDDMGSAYAWADLVICRAGAMTVFEIMSAGKAALFVPYPYAVDDHQSVNAAYLVDQGAAKMISPEKFSTDTLIAMLNSLLMGNTFLPELGAKARSLYSGGALEAIIHHSEEVIAGATTNVSS